MAERDERRGAFGRTVREIKDDNLPDWAAALTYYGVLSIFPALLALVSILGLLGRSTTDSLINNLEDVTPGAAKDIVSTALENLQNSRGSAGVLFVAGILVALWSASRYVAAFMRASNAIYDVEEGRPFLKKGGVRLGVTIVVVLMLVVTAIGIGVTGPLAEQAGDLLGISSTAVTVWNIAKWPVLLALVALIFAILYWASPNVKQPGFRWVTPGALLAVGVWLVASALFTLYVANFGSYNKTYGAFGAVIIFFVWLWITNLAILIGAEFDSERARERQIDKGQPPDQEPYLEPRDTTKMES